MKLNCEPRDLAVFVRSDIGNEGRVVRVLRLLTHAEMRAVGLGWCVAVWATDTPIPTRRGPMHVAIDEYIRPLRDPGEDARDESLSWLPVPSREEVSAC